MIMFRKFCGISLAVLSLLSMTSCVLDGSESGGANAPIEPQTQSNQDNDSQKDAALGLIYGLAAYDNLNVNVGDSTDWRYIIVTESGDLKIQFSLQQPDKIKGDLSILDAQGREMESRFFSRDVQEVKINVSRGIYYFRAQAAEGASDYVVKADFNPAEPAIATKIVQEVEEEEVVETSKPSRSSGSSKKTTTSNNVATGRIISFTEDSTNVASLKIRFDKAVKKGVVVKPSSNVTVTMTSCSGKICMATAKGKGINAVKKMDIVVELD